MSDELVAKLRELARSIPFFNIHDWWANKEPYEDALRQAADRIDALEAENAKLREALQKLLPDDWCDITRAINHGAVIDRYCPTCVARQALEDERE